MHPLRIDHVGLKVTDLAAAKPFYNAALEPLGMILLGESAEHAAFGVDHMPYLSIRLAEAVAGPAHVAFLAETRAQVDAFHAAAVAAGGRDGGPPGLRPRYHDNYYGAFVLDPDGHNIELVKHTPG